MLSGVSFLGRARGRAGLAVVADPAFFLLTRAALVVELTRVAPGGFEAFRGAALGDGLDAGAVERFFAIYQESVTACAQNHEFTMPTCGAVIRRAASLDCVV
jgi:hypothetical protein